ncbi:hypothetical protein [Actinokineospora sp. NPDC004072]
MTYSIAEAAHRSGLSMRRCSPRKAESWAGSPSQTSIRTAG